LDQGVIVERGNHHQLMAKGGLYASMWNRQREAAAAREKLELVDDEVAAPNRNPPAVEEADLPIDKELSRPPVERADAAEGPCRFSPPSAPSWRRSAARVCRSSVCSPW